MNNQHHAFQICRTLTDPHKQCRKGRSEVDSSIRPARKSPQYSRRPRESNVQKNLVPHKHRYGQPRYKKCTLAWAREHLQVRVGLHTSTYRKSRTTTMMPFRFAEFSLIPTSDVGKDAARLLHHQRMGEIIQRATKTSLIERAENRIPYKHKCRQQMCKPHNLT